MLNQKLKLAILDMYDGTPNQGMRAIKDIVNCYKTKLEWAVFDTRGAAEIPDISYDVYISTGGPGNPLEGDGNWDRKFYDFVDELWAWNASGKWPKKHVFFICHSFQMACQHFDLASITRRDTRSFGTGIVHKTVDGKKEPFFHNLPDPFYIADFRNYQIVQPDPEVFEAMNAQIVALEALSPYEERERAIMAVRFSPEFFGTQFHPEADPEGMMIHFSNPEEKKEIVQTHGERKFDRMMVDLKRPERIPLTYNTILPAFLDRAINSLCLRMQAT